MTAGARDGRSEAYRGPLLELRSISRSFPGVQALVDVDFDLRAGEVHALIGENGAGKSTLIKIIAGLVAPDKGEVKANGRILAGAEPALAQRLGIQVVYQELNLIGPMSVAENICLGAFPGSRGGRIDWKEVRRRASGATETVGLTLDVDEPVENLSVAEQQLVEIARALSREARFLILDEPTSALSKTETDRLFKVLGNLIKDDVGVIYVSHRLGEVNELADRITVLRDGRKVLEVSRGEADTGELVRAMVGRDLSRVHARTEARPRERVLAVEKLSTTTGLADVSFTVGGGEVVGVFGLVGSGLETLGRAIFGAEPITSGSIAVAQHSQSRSSPRSSRHLGLGMVPGNRKGEGLFLELSVLTNMTIAALSSLSTAGWLRAGTERRAARGMLDRLSIRTPSLIRDVKVLSGGNQQKVLLARWLLTEPAILLLAEPTRGVDVGAKAEIYKIIAEVADEGRGVLVLSTDAEEVEAVCHRVLVLRRGRVVAELKGGEATQEALLSEATAGPKGEEQETQ